MVSERIALKAVAFWVVQLQRNGINADPVTVSTTLELGMRVAMDYPEYASVFLRLMNEEVSPGKPEIASGAAREFVEQNPISMELTKW